MSVCGGTWPNMTAFIRAMQVRPSWVTAMLHPGKGKKKYAEEDILMALFTARVWCGWNADEDAVRDGMRELLGIQKRNYDKEAQAKKREAEKASEKVARKAAEKPAKKAAEKEAAPEYPEDARAAVALFWKMLTHHENSDLSAAHWNVEAAGEGRWKFRGEELTWIVEPERERLECWRKGVMVRKWEKGEYRT